MEVKDTKCSKLSQEVVLIEPFYGGSHKQLIDTLYVWLITCTLITQTAVKWHWRARTAALYAAEIIGDKSARLLFCSSVLNLSELLALCPQLHSTHKVVYFHENQLIYPTQRSQQRDFQFGYNEILTWLGLVADVVLFNSVFNQNSFLDGIAGHLKLMPDYRPKNLAEKIRPKCRVLYFPIEFPLRDHVDCYRNPNGPLHILWPHRWEHDKNPADFFAVIRQLVERGCKFQLSVLGESYGEQPDEFERAREEWADRIVHWGKPDHQQKYFEILAQCHVVVSTAFQETFGVAMMETVHLGCLPLCPNRLVYPELFPKDCLYNTTQQLVKRLHRYCDHVLEVYKDNSKLSFDTSRFSWTSLRSDYASALRVEDVL